MKFFGVFFGGLFAAFLFGKPSPGSPAGKLLQWATDISNGDEIPALHYFDIRGRAEAIRIAFADHDIKFTDSSFTSAEWGRNSQDGLKAKWLSEGKLLFGQVPMLEIDGISIVQSHSILRYLAAKYGWYDSLDASTIAHIDMVAEGTEDIRKQLTAIKYNSELEETEKQALYAKFFQGADLGVKWFGYFDSMASTVRGDSFIAGTKDATHADYLLFDLMDTCESLCPDHAKALFDSLKHLAPLQKRIAARPGISAYLDSDKRRPN